MKSIIVGVAIMLLGCGQDVQILSSDGNKLIAWCHSGNWVECVKRTCVNGYDIIKPSDNSTDGIIKCKPVEEKKQ